MVSSIIHYRMGIIVVYGMCMYMLITINTVVEHFETVYHHIGKNV